MVHAGRSLWTEPQRFKFIRNCVDFAHPTAAVSLTGGREGEAAAVV